MLEAHFHSIRSIDMNSLYITMSMAVTGDSGTISLPLDMSSLYITMSMARGAYFHMSMHILFIFLWW